MESEKLRGEVDLLREQVVAAKNENARSILIARRLEAEVEKIRIEAAKLERERILYPIALAGGLLVAVGTAIGVVIRLAN